LGGLASSINRLALVALCALACAAPGRAADASIHVSAAASPGGEGSADSPFPTIQEAADIAEPGQTVLIGAGRYRETVTPADSGTEGQPITFEGAPGEEVVIDGTEVLTECKARIGRRSSSRTRS
jgi:hypothetical protein